MEAPNLCDRFSDDDLKKIGELVWRGYDRDEHSRAAWKARNEAGMSLALQVQEAKNFPWPGCSNVVFPLVTIASLQFSARSYTNLIQGTDIVRYRIAGQDEEGGLREQADRIGQHMSWQVLEEDAAWEEQHDRLLINLGIVGTNFIKTYYDASQGHIVSELVAAKDLVMDYWARSVEACARKTQVILRYPNEIYERIQGRVFRDVRDEDWFRSKSRILTPRPEETKRSGTTPSAVDEDTPFRLLEQHRLLDLDDDGYAEPYIVTIEETSRTVLRIVSRFVREEDIERAPNKEVWRIRAQEYYTKYSFIPSPDGGIYDVGFGTLLGPLNESVNAGINQLIDSGTMQNSMGGFLGRGAKIRGGVYTMAPWEWKRVDSTGDDLRKSLVPLPERPPSAVMFQLLGLLIDYTDRISGSTDVMVGKNPGQNTPAESYRSMLEQGSQVYNMVFKRVWRSMKEEFKKRHRLNAVYLKSVQGFGSRGQVIRKADYQTNPDMVVPVADPNVMSAAQRLSQAQMLRMASKESAGYNPEEVEKNFLRALRMEGINKYYDPKKFPPPQDPRLQLEQIKGQTKAAELRLQQATFMAELEETIRLNSAKIAQLEATALASLAEVGMADAKVKIEGIRSIVDAMAAHNKALTDRLKVMQGGTEGESKGVPSERGGVPGLAPPPSNAGVPGLPAGMEGEPPEPMGGGELPGE